MENRRITILNSKWKFKKKDGYGKDRFVRIPRIAVRPLEQWKQIIGRGTWFLPSDKSPDIPMRKKTLYEQFHHYLKLAGLDEIHFKFKRIIKSGPKKDVQTINKYKLNFHSFRAYYVVDCRKKGIPVEIIAEQLGHVDINTTIGYARYLDEEKDDILDRAFDKIYSKEVIPITKTDKMESRNITSQNVINIKPKEYLQMQFLQGKISEEEYSNKFAIINNCSK